MSDKRFIQIILTLVGLTAFALRLDALEIRFAPGEYVYLAQDNRFLGIANFQIQNLAIINDGDETVQVNEVLVEIRAGTHLLETEHHSGEMLEKRWSMLKKYLDEPGMMKSEDPRFRFQELLGKTISLASTTKLAPQTAIYLSRRFHFAHAVVEYVDGKPKAIWPDQIIVTATGITVSGNSVSAKNALRIIYYQPKNEYHFPVRGRWYIASSSSVRSHHRLLPVHEFALDLIQIGAGGSSHEGDGTKYDDYYAYGENVYAIADGVVVAVYDDVEETRLKRKNESLEDYRKDVLQPFSQSEKAYYASGGNQVVIRHNGEEYSSFAHLKQGSIFVKKGDSVKRGQLIAQIGLSGDGYQPHLHFQITDGSDMSYGRGIPMIFTNVRPVAFSSTIDTDGRRQLQTGEFIETFVSD